MTIEVQRDGAWSKVDPSDLTTEELCEVLSRIQIDSDEFISPSEIDEGYASIQEAVRRLMSSG